VRTLFTFSTKERRKTSPGGALALPPPDLKQKEKLGWKAVTMALKMGVKHIPVDAHTTREAPFTAFHSYKAVPLWKI